LTKLSTFYDIFAFLQTVCANNFFYYAIPGMKSESETSPRNKSTYKWLDGSKLMQAFWANNQPDGRRMCVFSNAEEEWEDGDCHHKRPYACFTKG